MKDESILETPEGVGAIELDIDEKELEEAMKEIKNNVENFLYRIELSKKDGGLAGLAFPRNKKLEIPCISEFLMELKSGKISKAAIISMSNLLLAARTSFPQQTIKPKIE